VSRFDAPRLAALEDTSRWQFRGQQDILALAGKLQAAQGIADIEPPAGLGLALRPYQREGLAWLQFLRANDLSGILADDMGLGKTAQTLAHLLLEKEGGRLDRPALIILPTSLIFNWKNEAARFAPGLSVLSLHGPERKSRFAEIPAHDVVLTTYPLLWRDADELMQHRYHLLILDEAQTVKNARSQGAEAVRKIDARHRLCLTGTPLENHLGELWSQFDFLLPGFLGDSRQFTRYWRTPVEKLGDRERRDLLARRIRPFILRRRKEDVARELPPKTIIVRSVELEGAQRDLYETVRAAMDSKVREEIALRGFARSQIVILDALLKLRQVCCDPRLVKASAARKVAERAKLDLLMAMLPELVDEGRRILVFSQFTSMLALIEDELTASGIPYALLTGDTADREAPIRRFQEGEVPVFLISLKAGGLGLNLTAADTVIHYDPWWNPAVENQATDRAHRLGQDKPVFVYKLIVAGSIEEKILALQERKAELAAGILSEDRSVEVKFGSDDLAALFEPLPG
jgi:SNF2 family DNA or RNA helicase